MKQFWHRISKQLRQFVHSRDLTIYFFFVLLATLIWLIHAISTKRTITTTVAVEYTHIPDDYIFTHAPATRVRATIEDEGIDLIRARKRHYTITFDLSELISGEAGTLTITLDEIRQAITQQLAGDAALVAFAPEHLTGTYTRQHEKIVPVEYIGSVKPATQYQLCSDIQISPCSVRIYGTEQAISHVERITTVTTDYEGVQDTFTTRMALLAPEGIRLIPDSVSLHVIAEQFTEKILTIPITTPDLTSTNQRMQLFPNQVQVTFRVGMAAFNTITEDNLHASVELPPFTTDKLPVKIECNTPHITHIRIKPEEVEYLIEHYENNTDGRPANPISAH